MRCVGVILSGDEQKERKSNDSLYYIAHGKWANSLNQGACVCRSARDLCIVIVKERP